MVKNVYKLINLLASQQFRNYRFLLFPLLLQRADNLQKWLKSTNSFTFVNWLARTQNYAHAQLQTTITEIVRMKNFPTPQYRKPARWWRWKYKTLWQQNFPLPPPPGKTFDNKCPTLGSLWPCYPLVSARFSSPIKKGEEKKETWLLFFLLFPTAKNLDQALTIETNRPTVVCGRFPGSHGYLVCARGLHDPSFSSWGYFGFEPSRMLVVFLIWDHFLSLLIGCSYCLVHNRICIVIMKYVIGKAFG